jgi:hypothetical protein
VTWGGVATRSGDFWCTRIVDLWRREVGSDRPRVGGEKAAMVGFGSLLLLPAGEGEASSGDCFCGVDMC